MDPSSAPLPNTGPSITGPAIVGVTLNWWLYGILVMQYYMYISNANRDGKLLRAIVHFLFLLDTVQTIMTMDDMFYWFVYNFGNYHAIYNFNTAGINSPFMDAVIAFVVQLVYCWRVWVLGKWKILPAVIAFLALVACVNGMFIGIHDVTIKSILAFAPVYRAFVYLWLFSSAVTDILIASSMTYLLLKFRAERGSRTTVAAVKRILVLTLETNALTTALAIVIVVIFLVPSISPPNTNIYVPGGYLLGKLYNNSFMVLLNQRLYYEASARRAQEIRTFSSNAIRSNVSNGHDHTYHPDPHDGQNQSAGQVSIIRILEQNSGTRRGSIDSATIELGSVHSPKNGHQDLKFIPRDMV